jgi:hypothetical protein
MSKITHEPQMITQSGNGTVQSRGPADFQAAFRKEVETNSYKNLMTSPLFNPALANPGLVGAKQNPASDPCVSMSQSPSMAKPPVGVPPSLPINSASLANPNRYIINVYNGSVYQGQDPFAASSQRFPENSGAAFSSLPPLNLSPVGGKSGQIGDQTRGTSLPSSAFSVPAQNGIASLPAQGHNDGEEHTSNLLSTSPTAAAMTLPASLLSGGSVKGHADDDDHHNLGTPATKGVSAIGSSGKPLASVEAHNGYLDAHSPSGKKYELPSKASYDALIGSGAVKPAQYQYQQPGASNTRSGKPLASVEAHPPGADGKGGYIDMHTPDGGSYEIPVAQLLNALLQGQYIKSNAINATPANTGNAAEDDCDVTQGGQDQSYTPSVTQKTSLPHQTAPTIRSLLTIPHREGGFIPLPSGMSTTNALYPWLKG